MDAPQEGQVLIDTPFFDRDGSPAMPAYLSPVGRRYYLDKMVSSMPEVVQQRIVVLKNLQLDQMHLEAEFYGELAKLQHKYRAKYQPLYEKRRDIIAGHVDPGQEARKWTPQPKGPQPQNVLAADEIGDFLRDSLERCTNLPKDVKGIPDFWVMVFKNTPMLCDMLHPKDIPAMGKLTDIAVRNVEQGDSFVLEFHFAANTFFSNPVLTKQYFQRIAVKPEDPFQFDGPELYRCRGCAIDWLPNMNLTMRTVTKRQRHKQTGMVRSFTQQMPLESFFNFFNPPELEAGAVRGGEDNSSANTNNNNNNNNDHIMRVLEADYDVGHFLRTRIIPRAVLYYTGDVVDDEEDELEDDDDDFSSSEDSNDGEGGRKHSVNECPTH